MSKINRDKCLDIWEPERFVMSCRDKCLELWRTPTEKSRHPSHFSDVLAVRLKRFMEI